MAAILSLTESQAFTALRAMLVGILPANVPVVQAQANRVAEPQAADFVLMTPVGQRRLGTNDTEFGDNIVTGSIAGALLTVSAIVQGALTPGALLLDTTGILAPGTVLGMQQSGTPGGVGTYAVTPAQTVASETIYAGLRSDLVPTELAVQLDVHGPGSADNAKIIEGLFRSGYAIDAFAASGFDITPLYCSDARQIPFVNDQNQVENRWVVEAEMQINPVISTPQQFASQVAAKVVEAAPDYTGP